LIKVVGDVGATHASPLRKKLVGIEMREPGIARQGYKFFSGDRCIGSVTSGTKSPTLDRAIALGYVEPEFSSLGTKIAVDIHNKKRDAEVIAVPFYRKSSSKI
jgi:aminomethyltransferase